jgi:hypothetical protein
MRIFSFHPEQTATAKSTKPLESYALLPKRTILYSKKRGPPKVGGPLQLAGEGWNLAGDQRADRRFLEATIPITANALAMTA